MNSTVLESDVRVLARELTNAIRIVKNSGELLECLKKLDQLLPKLESPDMKDEKENSKSAIFMKNHYSSFAYLLLDTISVDLCGTMSKNDFELNFQTFFLNGCPEDAFLALTNALYTTGPGFKVNKCVIILEDFLQQHKFGDILLEQCGLYKDADMTVYTWKSDGRALLWEALLSQMAALPDKMANKLKTEMSDIFLPKYYIAIVMSDILKTLAITCKRIRQSKDCHLEFLSQLLGKLCLCGYADQVWGILLRHVSELVRKDYIWSRVLERVVTGVPDKCIETVLVPLIKAIPWYGLMDKFLGNCVTENKKIQLLICTKLVFHRYFKSTLLLQNIIGYLATSTPRQHLFVKLLFEILQVWGDQSCVSHTSYEQHVYITQALVICMAFISETHKQEHRDEILRILMPGVQVHIGCSEPKSRRLGMMIAEVVTATVDPEGPKLNFEYEEDSEIISIKTLLTLPESRVMTGLQQELSSLHLEKPEGGDVSREGNYDVRESGREDTNRDSQTSTNNRSQNMTQNSTSTQQSESDLDSDDDLEPFDMSHDQKVSKVKQPKYIRDCMEGLIGCEDPDKLEVCLGVTEKLVRSKPDGIIHISVEFTKVLIHLTEGFSIPNFRSLRFNALVALAVTCPKQVAEYLTEQFYDRNYSIRQRLDIIEVIGTAAQELSKPLDVKHEAKPADQPRPTGLHTSSAEPETWREVVQRRIDSKTRRFGQGRSKPEHQPTVNRFSSVAGYFFFPLMKNFDRQENTFDLMGEDCFVLGRLMYTLGIVMYAATNIPTVRQMALCLLEFIWVLRFHTESSVRQGLLFAISMVYLSVPAHILLDDLQQEVFESKNWLEDVIDKDVDTQCKTLAVQALVLLENIIKQDFLLDSETL